MDALENKEWWSSLGVTSVLTEALLDQHFFTPTDIQCLTIPPAILGRRDILGAAETGSGKTLAFGLPILNGILDLKRKEKKVINSTSGVFQESNINEISENEDNDDNFIDTINISEDNLNILNNNSIKLIQINNKVETKNFLKEKPKKPLYGLILTPTRELAIQIKDHLSKVAKYTDIKIAVVVGGMAAVKQERILNKGPEIVVATPGRLWELINEGNPHLNQVDFIRYLVIDETDRMLEKGHFLELHNIIERLNSNESRIKGRQTFVFSATLTIVHDMPDYLQRKKMRNSNSKIFKLTPEEKLQRIIHMLKLKNPKVIDITKGTGTNRNLTECRIACTIDHKDYYLYYFLKRHPGRTLIFCNSIGCVKRLVTLFGILNCNPLALHASMPQRQRLKNLERFQVNVHGLMISTDVAARGLDIPCIEHVIHYQVPRTCESYIHRSGRTARASMEGITVLIMEPSEKHFYSRLCKTLNRTQDLPAFPVLDRLLLAVKERVNIAREIDKLELTCRRDNSQKGWLQKAAKEMDLLLDDDAFDTTTDSKGIAVLKRMLKSKKNKLAIMLKKPLFPNNFSGKFLDNSFELLLDHKSEKAIDAMKNAMNNSPKLTKVDIQFASKRKL